MRKASLFHLPISIIVDIRTFARYRSIAALVLSDWVPTLLMSMPSFSGPIVLTEDTRWRLTWVEVNRTSFPVDTKNVLTVDLFVAFG